MNIPVCVIQLTTLHKLLVSLFKRDWQFGSFGCFFVPFVFVSVLSITLDLVAFMLFFNDGLNHAVSLVVYQGWGVNSCYKCFSFALEYHRLDAKYGDTKRATCGLQL